MKKLNIIEGEWGIDNWNGQLQIETEDDIVCKIQTFNRYRAEQDAQAISAVPNAVDDYAEILHAIENCKTNNGAVILGDKLEESIKSTAKKMGFDL